MAYRTYKITCQRPGCKTEFTAGNANTKYCCDECKLTMKRKKARDYERRVRGKNPNAIPHTNWGQEVKTYGENRVCSVCGRGGMSMYTKGDVCSPCREKNGNKRGTLGRGSAPSVNQGRGLK